MRSGSIKEFGLGPNNTTTDRCIDYESSGMNSKLDTSRIDYLLGDSQLNDTKIVVVGLGSGGMAVLERLAMCGVGKWSLYDPDHLEAVRLELEDEFPAREVRAVAADLADAEQRLEVYDWIADLGADLNILVNNVGGNTPRPTLACSDDDVRGLFENNVMSAFSMARQAHPLLTRHAATAIVNITSIAGHSIHPFAGSAYST